MSLVWKWLVLGHQLSYADERQYEPRLNLVQFQYSVQCTGILWHSKYKPVYFCMRLVRLDAWNSILNSETAAVRDIPRYFHAWAKDKMAPPFHVQKVPVLAVHSCSRLMKSSSRTEGRRLVEEMQGGHTTLYSKKLWPLPTSQHLPPEAATSVCPMVALALAAAPAPGSLTHAGL